jgi:hypothetical protein
MGMRPTNNLMMRESDAFGNYDSMMMRPSDAHYLY